MDGRYHAYAGVVMTVNRWHCYPDARLRNSGDTIERHQIEVERFCRQFSWALKLDTGRRAELLHAARHHDEAETVLGDIPGPAKARFPALAAAYEEAEREVLADMGLSWSLTPQEAHILHLADKLEAELWARRHGVTGTHDCDKLQALADRLGLGEVVRNMLGE